MESFVGKEFIQNIDAAYVTITKSEEIIEYMQNEIHVQKMILQLLGDKIDLCFITLFFY